MIYDWLAKDVMNSIAVKIVALGPDAIFYRYLTPKWAFVPLSGAGAASEGGRFNRAK